MTTTSPRTIIKADISISSRFKVVFAILCIICIVVPGIIAYSEASYRTDNEKWDLEKVIYNSNSYSYETLRYYYSSVEDYLTDPDEYLAKYFREHFTPLFLVIFAPSFGVVIITYASMLYTIKRCSLVLTDKGLSGQRKKIFSTTQLQLPMNKIDNIMVKQNLISTFFGGKTVSIRSASGLIKFICVQNADEFVRVTLAEIEKYNKSLKNVDKNLVSAIAGNSAQKAQPENSATQKIKDLKELLDSGLITQDEFDAKKKDLLNKM